jgi:hypothetical protein
MFQNLRVSSPAPVTIVCVNGKHTLQLLLPQNILFLNRLLCDSSVDLPAHQVTLQGKAHAVYVQLELPPSIFRNIQWSVIEEHAATLHYCTNINFPQGTFTKYLITSYILPQFQINRRTYSLEQPPLVSI